MPEQCKLLLDNYTGQYTPGATIVGRVLVNLDSDTNIRGILTQFIYYEVDYLFQKFRDKGGTNMQRAHIIFGN